MRDIPPVASFDLSKSYEFVTETFGDTAKSFGPALNVNTLDEVPDSSWFTNRLGRHDMTIDEVVRGPDTVDGPAPGIWMVTGRPGCRHHAEVHDQGRARRHVSDQARPGRANPELPSSVEMISTKIFHAIGYHVPEDFIVTFDVEQLRCRRGRDDHARIRARSGRS